MIDTDEVWIYNYNDESNIEGNQEVSMLYIPHQAGDSRDLTSSPAYSHTTLILPHTAKNKLSNKKAHLALLVVEL